jgi:hypothetical protein
MGEWKYILTILDFGTRWRWIAGWVGHRVGLDAIQKRKVSP